MFVRVNWIRWRCNTSLVEVTPSTSGPSTNCYGLGREKACCKRRRYSQGYVLTNVAVSVQSDVAQIAVTRFLQHFRGLQEAACSEGLGQHLSQREAMLTCHQRHQGATHGPVDLILKMSVGFMRRTSLRVALEFLGFSTFRETFADWK